jgi:hypothetical protein
MSFKSFRLKLGNAFLNSKTNYFILQKKWDRSQSIPTNNYFLQLISLVKT